MFDRSQEYSYLFGLREHQFQHICLVLFFYFSLTSAQTSPQRMTNYRAFIFTPHEYGTDMSISPQPLDIRAVIQSILILTCVISISLEV